MDGEEDEASTVNEPALEVGAEESALASARVDEKCEPESFGVTSDSEPPPQEFAGIAGGDAAVEAKGEGSEGNEVENGDTEKDLYNGAREEEKDEVFNEEVSAAAAEEEEEVVVVAADEDDRSVKEVEMASEAADLDDVSAEKSAIASEKNELAETEVGESEIVSVEGGIGNGARAESLAGEEGGEAEAAAVEIDTADVVPEVEAESAMDSEAAEEGDSGVNEETEKEMEEGQRDPAEEEEETEGEAKGDEDGGAADEAMEAEAEDEKVVDAMEETEAADEAEEMEVTEKQETGRGKRKRGRNQKAPARAPLRKKTEEDVCFICFDGGELVLCDRRGCPKAYHPSCVNRDVSFFRTKGRWNCGWHLCSNCEKNAYYMCYTCTFSLCKACVKDAVILCVRGNKGFCETCMKTVKMIENNEGNKNDNVNFDEKSSWEYLFKDYWTDLKEQLSLTLDELAEAKNPWKGSSSDASKQESADEPLEMNNDVDSDTDGSSGNEPSHTKKRKTRKRAKSRSKDKDSRRKATTARLDGIAFQGSNEWASKELLEFVMHMRDGDSSVLSQFDVQALLLEYIKRNKLRDPRRKSQIICDSRLENLFGKPRVGHFEMLKLLESHFLIKEDTQIDDFQGSVVDTEASQLEADGNSDVPGKAGKDKKRKNRRRSDGKGPQSNLEDYAAIDTHNINLIYLRRNLVEDLIDDAENFHNKVVGAFVRIRIAGNNQKQDLYRLVQVTGTCKAAEPYKVGKKISDTCLEILNLNKTEIVSMDIISNQDFTEEECKRLRQSIKCGLINRLTVGDIQEKAIALQAVRVKDWLESEVLRLSHLRDRASETGRRKELRECVEKLQLLKTPEERLRRLEEIPEIHTDPNMDPNFESEEEEANDKRQEKFMRSRGSSFGRRGKEPISPRKGGSASSDAWSGTRNYSSISPELSKSMSSRGFYNKMEDTTGAGEIVNDLWNHGRDKEVDSWERHKMSTLETGSRTSQSAVVHDSGNTAMPSGISEPVAKINEAEKIWHYKDPSGKVQGPFSIVQLRKWNATGYFPADLRIWRQTEKLEDAILLSDALAGKFQKEKAQPVLNLHPSPTQSAKLQGLSSLQRALEVQVGVESWRSPNDSISLTGKAPAIPVEVPKYASDGWGTTNLPSPTPSQTPVGAEKVQAFESKWSSNPGQSSGSLSGINQLPGNTTTTQENNSLNSHPGAITPSKPEQLKQSGTTNDLPVHHLSSITAPDINTVVSNLQSLVQSVASHLPPAETQGWVSVSAPKQETMVSTPTPGGESQPWRSAPPQKVEPSNPALMQGQPPAHGLWNNSSTAHTPSSAFNSGNTGANFSTPGFQAVPSSDPWRPPISSNQPNNQPQPWGTNVVDNQNGAPRLGQENQNSGWGPVPTNQNMAWGGPPPVQGNANANWGVQGQSIAPGSTNSGWSAAPNQGPTHGNPVSGWGPLPMNNNANLSWGGLGQGPAPGNANSSWGPAPSGNQANWGNERSHNSDRYGNNRDTGSHHGGDPSYTGAKPWNRQSSFGSGGGGGGGGGGGSSRPPFKGQRVCKFHESGHCRKGASCDYLHT